MLIDSHCHLDRIDLTPYNNDFSCFMAATKSHKIDKMLAVCIDLESYPALLELIDDYNSISVSVGVHPNTQEKKETSVEDLVQLGENPRVVAIGETGLDYFRSEGDLSWQHARLRNHIQAAKQLGKPLIIHTRDAGEDTLKILKQEQADQVGGVIHCFTEDWNFAQQALDLNFYISFSGIVTFKNTKEVQDTAKKVPSDRYLIETDSPYLSPVPFRGKSNYPLYVKYVAEKLAELRDISVHEVAATSSQNYCKLFNQKIN
jgi:TatD DNase family protein